MEKEKKFSKLIEIQAEKYGKRPVIYDRNKLTDPWLSLNWEEFNDKVRYVARMLVHLGIESQMRIAQFSQNKSENLIVDFAAFSIRAVVVPIYPTSSQSQVEFITNDSESQLIFVGGQKQYDIAVETMKNSKHIKQIIVFESDTQLDNSVNSIYFDELLVLGEELSNDDEIVKRQSESLVEDMTCLLYTSGTTGNPKGVVMTNEMFDEAMRIHQIRLPQLNDQDVSLAFLPITHVFERMWCYLLLYLGATLYINHNPAEIQTTLKDVRPTLMTAIPRFWEKVAIGVQEVLASYSPLKLAIVTWSMAIGKKYNIDYLRKAKEPSAWLKARYKIADKLVFSKLKDTIGVNNAKGLPVAGAKLSNEILLFFKSMGLPLIYGYGLTETTATVSCFEDEYRIGTVGRYMPGVEVKIGEDNEILLKGKTITKAYFNNEEANKAAFTEDGWFRTGDAGYLKDGEYIVLTERIKDLFKTSNGKYIAPQEIETRLGKDKYIEQVAVIGNERNFVTAIISPNIPLLEKYAKEQNLQFNTTEELIELPEIYKLIEERIAEHQAGMAHFEMIKKFTLIKFPFTIETGELTNTLKIRRAVIMQKYQREIDKMYQ